MSLARNHKLRVLAEKQSVATAQTSSVKAQGSEHDLMYAGLRAHEITLKLLKSIKAKIEMKAEFLPEYSAYVDGVLAADTGLQDQVIMKIMVWRLDVGDLAGALEIGEYALRHDLKMPEQFSRDAATMLLEQASDYILESDDTTREAEFINILAEISLLTTDHDMPDEVRAKANKALGILLQETDVEAAISYLKLALDYDTGSGVKTLLKRLEKALEKSKSELVAPTE